MRFNGFERMQLEKLDISAYVTVTDVWVIDEAKILICVNLFQSQ